jgi:Uncharacterised nucleotidyltransferase
MQLTHARATDDSQIRKAVLLVFCESLPAECDALWHISSKEWQRLLPWLDTSGLALYFFDRITQLGRCGILPPTVLKRLEGNLADNINRTDAMIAESNAIHLSFQEAELAYAALKGFSLWPVSVPRPELRSQLDLDFLIAARDAPKGRQILESRGYRLKAISGRSWEFIANEAQRSSLEDLYKITPHRIVELHLEAEVSGRAPLLARADNLRFRGVDIPILAPVDLFLGQGLHLFKHVSGEFSRAAHFVEFRRHVLARYHDHGFWRELRDFAEGDLRATVGLGVVTLMVAQVMGDFAPRALTCWTVDRLPVTARLWVELYGHRTILASPPGSKLYLLLQKELNVKGLPAKRSLQQILLPRRLPPAITQSSGGETLPTQIRRYRRQARHILFRLRFHFVEGVRYLLESIRLRRHIEALDK